MTLELPGEDATLILEFVEGRLIELKKEINRTDNMAFRQELRKTERALERLTAQLSKTSAG